MNKSIKQSKLSEKIVESEEEKIIQLESESESEVEEKIVEPVYIAPIFITGDIHIREVDISKAKIQIVMKTTPTSRKRITTYNLFGHKSLNTASKEILGLEEATFAKYEDYEYEFQTGKVELSPNALRDNKQEFNDATYKLSIYHNFKKIFISFTLY